MATTTIRVDLETHAALVELSESAGATIADTVRQSVASLRRQRFGEQVAREIAALAADPQGWAAYLQDAELTEVDDGIPR